MRCRAFLRALGAMVEAARRHKVPVGLCGEMGGRPLEAMALIGLGFRSLSMAPASIGPVKAMIRSMHAERARAQVHKLMAGGEGSIREGLRRFAEIEGIDL